MLKLPIALVVFRWRWLLPPTGGCQGRLRSQRSSEMSDTKGSKMTGLARDPTSLPGEAIYRKLPVWRPSDAKRDVTFAIRVRKHHASARSPEASVQVPPKEGNDRWLCGDADIQAPSPSSASPR